MATGLLHLHSALRWIVLILMVATIIKCFIRIYRPFRRSDEKLPRFTLIAFHTQILVGILLYAFSPTMHHYFMVRSNDIMGDSTMRFWVVEHPLMMLIAAIVLTVGYVRAKRQSLPWAKYRMIFFYYLAALLFILVSIPWPFRESLGRGWF